MIIKEYIYATKTWLQFVKFKMLLHTFPMFIQFIIYIPVVISSTSTFTEIGQQYNGLLIRNTGSTGPLNSFTTKKRDVNPMTISAKN